MAAEDPAWVRNLHVAADRRTTAYRRAFLDSVIAARADLDVAHIEKLLRAGRVAEAYRVAEMTVDLASQTMQRKIMAATIDGMRVGAAAAQTTQRLIIPGGFDIFNPETQLWAQNYTYDLVREMRADQLAAIRNAITRTTSGATYMEAAREIRGTIGLTERMERTVGNYRARLVTQQLPAKRVDVLTSRYRDKMIRRRAETIARTESVRAVNQGQVQAWRQWSTTRQIPVMKRWITTRDDLLCEFCRPMNKQTVPLNGLFMPKSGPGVDAPPLHPNCRCVVALVKATTPKQQRAAIAGMRAAPTGLVARFKPANVLLQEALLRVATAAAPPAASSVEALTELFTGPARAPVAVSRVSPPSSQPSAATVDASQVIREWAAQNRFQRELRQAVRTGAPRPRMTASMPPPRATPTPVNIAPDLDAIDVFGSVTVSPRNPPNQAVIDAFFGKGATPEGAFKQIAVKAPGDDWAIWVEGSGSNTVVLRGATSEVSTTRVFTLSPSGRKVVTHDYFRLDKNLQNSGFSKRQLGKQFRFYRDSGIDEVRVHANIDVGGYAWARAGFLPNSRADMYALASYVDTAAQALLDERAISLAARQQITKLVERLNAGDGTAVWDVADLRDVVTADILETGTPVTQELGKHLLKHSDWEGSINMHAQAQTERLFHYYGEK